MQKNYADIIGIGAHLPQRVVSNDDLSSFVDTSDEWIRSRTGIERRHFAADSDTASSLALPACRDAMAQAGVSGSDLDLIVFATTTPDRIYPATACLLQHELEAAPCSAFDVQAVCSGFLYALAVAESMIASGRVRTALVVGAEVFSGIIDWRDRSTCVLFGDGAGAAVLRASDTPGILAITTHANGKYADKLTVNAKVRGGELQGDPYTRMDGGTVYRFAVGKMTESANAVIAEGNRKPDWLVLHQANSRIIEGVCRRLEMPDEKCINCVHECANTSAASIPIALFKAAPKISKGDTVLLAAAGGGFTWGAALLQWNIATK